jgi:hypothetical protein
MHQPNFAMKNQINPISIALAAGLAGAAFGQLANASILSTLRADIAAAVIFSGAILGLAVYDYTRRLQLLAVAGPALRPTLHAGHPSVTARVVRREKALVEKVAA